MSSEINSAVDAILESAGVKVICTPTGTQKRDNWECDGWRFNLSTGRTVGEDFEYFTGTGHRSKVEDHPRGRLEAHALRNASRNSLAWEKLRKQYCKPVAPHVAGLIYSLLADGMAAEMSFTAWCNEFGYDSDSRKALATYEACQENSDKFNRLFNASQRAALAAALEDY